MMSVKEQLYYLIKHVKLGNYDINTFCDMFTNLVNLEMWKEEFSEKETAVFNELNKYTSRFSPFEEDLKLPNVFYDEKAIKEQIDIALNDLEIDIVS